MAQVLDPVRFADLQDFADDDCLSAFRVFARSAKALVERLAPTRPAVGASPAQLTIARDALSAHVDDSTGARNFFECRFQPYRVRPDAPATAGFLTGYYEPRLFGSLIQSAEFTGPVLARPDDLVAFADKDRPSSFDPALSGARRLSDGALAPYPERAIIEAQADAGETRPILWLRDPVEVFMAQVQGSASVELDDGRIVRLAYDGRNGQPYTSIGRRLIESGEIAEADMSLARLKEWLRANGLAPGDKARKLMQANRSYVFFKIETRFDPADGPTGGAGVGLTALRSIAVDRNLWAYGTPFWLEASLPWRGPEPSPFRRLTIAQDTGSAILGPARADLYFGGGDQAGRRAGDIRHPCDFTVLLPRGPAG
jgi:membrane-bound lytic murein transglycosylase A